MINEHWRNVRKVLAVRLDNLGDVLVTTPAIHAIREALPDAQLTLLASPVGAQAGKLNNDIDTVITYRSPWMDPWHKLAQDPEREQAMIERLAREQFDAAIIFTSFRQSSLPAAYLCYLAGIPLRAAASIDGPGSLLTTRHKHPERMMHEVERGLDLVGALGMGTVDRDLVLDLPASAFDDANAFIERSSITGKRPLVVVHPGCSMPARTYPAEMFADVVALLIHETQATVVLTGVESEIPLVEYVRERVPLPQRERVTFGAGTLSFGGFSALVALADLVITNNTGPMHVAAATKTPVVALFALTNPPEQWGPWQVAHRQLFHDVPCRICYSRVCPYQQECLTLVTPEIVVASAQQLLAESKAAAPSLSLEVIR